MDLDGKIADGTRKPSSEWGLHAGFYRAKPDIGAVVHTALDVLHGVCHAWAGR